MYAVIESGGKQYRVKEGQLIQVERLNAEIGSTIEFDKILMSIAGDKTQIGAPYLKGPVVKAEVLSHDRGEKIKIIKFRRRKHHMKKMGHRQNYTQLKITAVKV
jgi:large subunit ribosomal protein L21